MPLGGPFGKFISSEKSLLSVAMALRALPSSLADELAKVTIKLAVIVRACIAFLAQ